MLGRDSGFTGRGGSVHDIEMTDKEAGMRSAKTLGAGPIQNAAGQKVAHIEAGSIGRLIKACMNVARNHPEWRATGATEEYDNDGSKVYRQRIERD